MIRRKFILFFVLFSWWTAPLFPGLIIKYDKNGKIIISNSPVKTYPKKSSNSGRFFTPSRSGFLSTTLKKKIYILSRKYSVRTDLITAVARAESGFNPYAVSSKGAVGIMQLTDETAKKYNVVNRYNMDQNLEAGVRHLKYLKKRYKNNLRLMLAAYNAGENAVAKYKGIPPYKETRTYIKRVLHYMGMKNTSIPGNYTRVYKIVTDDGRIIITDTVPGKVNGKIERIN